VNFTKPQSGNRTRGVEDLEIQKKIRNIVDNFRVIFNFAFEIFSMGKINNIQWNKFFLFFHLLITGVFYFFKML